MVMRGRNAHQAAKKVTSEDRRRRLDAIREHGRKTGAMGEPVYYNPHVQRSAEVWREGWLQGREDYDRENSHRDTGETRQSPTPSQGTRGR
jgi:hypothetical protein